jgi:predicted HAD superfamily phosphohydrolase YqeG
MVNPTTGGAYERLGAERDPVRRAAELSAQSIILDVEPFVAYWNGSQESLDRGIELVVGQVSTGSGARAVCFATNSSRRPTRLPNPPGIELAYFASARKPLRTSLYRDLPRPGVVIGDQVATDGILAYRLGYTFLHYCPEVPGVPLGSRLLSHLGRIVLLTLFRNAAAQPPDTP